MARLRGRGVTGDGTTGGSFFPLTVSYFLLESGGFLLLEADTDGTSMLLLEGSV